MLITQEEHNSFRRVGTFWKPYSCQVGSQQVSTDRCLRDPRQSMSRSHFSIPEHCFVAKQFCRDMLKYSTCLLKLLKYTLRAEKMAESALRADSTLCPTLDDRRYIHLRWYCFVKTLNWIWQNGNLKNKHFIQVPLVPLVTDSISVALFQNYTVSLV